MPNPIVVIPARMGSTRLPGKPMASIAGEPMIVHVWRRAREADLGPVLVATDDARVADAVRAAGGRVAMTRADHPAGSDRVHEAVERVDPDGSHDVVVNVQGDLPTLDPGAIRACLPPLADPAVDVATLAAVITRDEERHDPNVVKVVGTPPGASIMRALYFTRASAPCGPGPLFHHIGLYAYRRAALRGFVALPPSGLERRERLEQLRALEAGMRIDVAVVDAVPLGVDVAADLARVRDLLGD